MGCSGVKSGGNGAGGGQGVPAVSGVGSALWGQVTGAAPPHECSQQQPSIVTMAMPAVLRLSSVVTHSTCWDGLQGCAHPGGISHPELRQKPGVPYTGLGRLATKPSGCLRDGVPQGDTVAQAGAWPGDSAVRERRVKPFGVTMAVVAPPRRAPPHPKPIIKDDVHGGRGEVT